MLAIQCCHACSSKRLQASGCKQTAASGCKQARTSRLTKVSEYKQANASERMQASEGSRLPTLSCAFWRLLALVRSRVRFLTPACAYLRLRALGCASSRLRIQRSECKQTNGSKRTQAGECKEQMQARKQASKQASKRLHASGC